MVYQVGSDRRRERGQTIILVSIALIALMAMAALAIDVTALYVNRSETQRAANAAALAGAKIFATSGFTSVQTAGTTLISQGQMCAAATAAAQATVAAPAVPQGNTIGGQYPPPPPVTCNFANPLNPQVTVTVTRTGLPIFFARIWSRTSNSVSATATAEAYNPSGQTPPIRVSVKPWLIPNCDVNNPAAPHNLNCAFAPFVNSDVGGNDGSIVANETFIGKTMIVSKVPHGTVPNLTAGNSVYFPLNIPINPPTAACPSTSAIACGNVGSSTYLDNISCSSQYRLSCGDTVGLGNPVDIDNNNLNSLRTPAREGTQCMIHTTSVGDPPVPSEQDQFTSPVAPNTPPVMITGGTENPNLNLRTVQNISRSDSIITVPLYDGVVGGGSLNLCPGGACNQTATVVGFMQLGVIESDPPPTATVGSFKAVILNVAGCNPSATGNAVSGGGVSPVPVRLIGP
jgi:Putative Flp pilus-assembly TadE/G-like